MFYNYFNCCSYKFLLVEIPSKLYQSPHYSIALVESLCGGLLLAVLQLFVEERAGVRIPVVGLEAIEEQLLVVAADSTVGGSRHLWLLGGGGGGVIAAAGRSASAHCADSGSDGLVGNGTTGSKGHSLGNGRSDSGEHASTAGLCLLHGSGGGGSGRGGSRLGRCGTGRRGGRTGRGPAGTHTTSSSSLFGW